MAEAFRVEPPIGIEPMTYALRACSPCVARGFKACPSFKFAGCCWRRSLAVDGQPGTSRGHAHPRRSSLGYQSSGSGLRHLGRSPLCHLTSASVWEVVVYGALHLSRLSRARRISFTDWFTGVRGSPRAGAGKILPRPRRTVGGEKAGRPEPYTGVRGASPGVTVL